MQHEPKLFKAIIGLGNPGAAYARTRHNIGFIVLDALASKESLTWQEKEHMLIATVPGEHPIYIIKPQTFMNDSGRVWPWLQRKGIKPEEVLVIHDELEKPFGTLQLRQGGSARGHNGLRSLIQHAGPDFYRLRCGIGRPERKEEVATWVLSNFNEPAADLKAMIDKALETIHVG